MKNKKINFWIVMKPTCFFLEDWSFDELELIIESSDSNGSGNPIIDMLKKEFKCEYLIFTEFKNKDGVNEILRIIDLPYIEDWDGDDSRDMRRYGPFSTKEHLIDYINNLKTISFNDSRIEKFEC
jgi:uncharacterized protein YrzB (UPF0473 family)